MKPYTHKVQYYETDRMGITHHSNYIRWMEEARTDYLVQLGWPLEKLEERGVVSPVTALEVKYQNTTTFADEIVIREPKPRRKDFNLTPEFLAYKKRILERL